jgi:hypothetical protein
MIALLHYCIIASLHYCMIALLQLLHYCIRERGTNEPSEPMGDVAHNMIDRVTPPEQSERNNSSNIQTQQRSNSYCAFAINRST